MPLLRGAGYFEAGSPKGFGIKGLHAGQEPSKAHIHFLDSDFGRIRPLDGPALMGNEAGDVSLS